VVSNFRRSPEWGIVTEVRFRNRGRRISDSGPELFLGSMEPYPQRHPMSSRWGGFCTPDEYALSQQPYSPLHCYTSGEITGLLVNVNRDSMFKSMFDRRSMQLVVISSLVSMMTLLYIFSIIAVSNPRMEKHQRLTCPCRETSCTKGANGMAGV
jgi:hypothetical protein